MIEKSGAKTVSTLAVIDSPSRMLAVLCERYGWESCWPKNLKIQDLTRWSLWFWEGPLSRQTQTGRWKSSNCHIFQKTVHPMFVSCGREAWSIWFYRKKCSEKISPSTCMTSKLLFPPCFVALTCFFSPSKPKTRDIGRIMHSSYMKMLRWNRKKKTSNSEKGFSCWTIFPRADEVQLLIYQPFLPFLSISQWLALWC